MGKRKMRLPFAPHSLKQNKFLNLNGGMLSSIAVPGAGRQDSGYPGLCCAGWTGLECSVAA